MANEFEMSMIGELSYFLGLQIKQLKNDTFVSQGKYIKDMLKKFGMDDAKSISTPMGTNGSLDSDTSGNMVDQKLYRSMIGSLLYVTALRPDVMFSVCMCARFQASPRESHLKVQNLNLLDIPIRTMRDAKLKEEAHWAHVNYWEDHLSHGHPRNKVVLHYQPPKRNTLRPVVVVHKSYG